jgi:hypothetical protein
MNGHSERSEESSSAFEAGKRFAYPIGFFAALLMNLPVCHSERSEESSRTLACRRAAGFFAKPQNDMQGKVHWRESPISVPMVPRLRMTGRQWVFIL